MSHFIAFSVQRLLIRNPFGLVLTVMLCSLPTVQSAETFPDPAPVVKTFEWTLTPAKAPIPAFRYKFSSDLADSVAGNAATHYQRAVLLNARRPRETTDNLERHIEWNDLPIDQIDLTELRAYLNSHTGILQELKHATQCEMCDWGIRFQDLKGLDVFTVVLPEFQEARNLARLLRLKARLEIAEHKFDAAIDTIKQGYQLARHVGSTPSVICNLVAVAIQFQTTESVSELISTANSPNLYWALRSLPDPLIDSRPIYRFESSMAFRLFPFLKDADTAQRPAEEWSRLLTDVVVSLDDYVSRSETELLSTQVRMTAMILRSYSFAKRELIAAGYDQQRIEQMPVGQVVAIFARDCHQHVIDECTKPFLVSYEEGNSISSSVQQSLVDEGYISGSPNSTPMRDPLLINTRLRLAVEQLREADIRPRRIIASLMVVEAIRMHAATHEGRIPSALDEITVVPVPSNPTNGRPFLYRVTDAQAELLIPPLRAGDEYSGRRYLLKIK